MNNTYQISYESADFPEMGSYAFVQVNPESVLCLGKGHLALLKQPQSLNNGIGEEMLTDLLSDIFHQLEEQGEEGMKRNKTMIKISPKECLNIQNVTTQ